MSTTDQRVERWKSFIDRWPLASLKELTLDEYTQADNHAGFAGWVKFKTDGLGWRPKGGSNWDRIGVCALPADSRWRERVIQDYQNRLLSTVDAERGYCWRKSMGGDVETAFQSTKQRIVQLAEAAQRGDLSVLKAPQLHADYEWKVFFLYQDRNAPVLLPAQDQSDIRQWYSTRFKDALPAGTARTAEASIVANQRLMEARNGRPLFEYLDQLVGQPYSDDGEALDSSEFGTKSASSSPVSIPTPPLNQILYGPPGTGKTFTTIDAALDILDGAFSIAHAGREGRAARKARFDELVQERRIRFVTFHQSFSYEDFVEGLRATTNEDTGQIRYEVVDGVFKSLCEAAAAKVTLAQGSTAASLPIDVRGRRIWKMSLGNTLGSDAAVYDESIEKGYALLGYGGTVDFTGCQSRADVLERCIAGGLQIDNPQTDYTVTSVAAFVTRMKPGDLLVISDGNFKFRAIGEVSGEYKFQPHSDYPDGYAQMRQVKWLRVYKPSLPHSELMNSQFSQMTLYELRVPSIDLDKLQRLLADPQPSSDPGALRLGQVGNSDYQITKITGDLVELTKPNGNKLHFAQSLLRTLADGVRSELLSVEDIRDKQAIARLPNQSLEPYVVNGYANVLAPLVEQMLGKATAPTHGTAPATASDARVLIIDEINRGNISRIFGELITLIEPSKRAGADEALEVVLPYSKTPFSVPSNVYLIGTMNTADRSLTGMDVALRRRFEFREMPPLPAELKGINVDGIEVDRLLDTMNQRIEALLDRDHRLGHAYFMPLREQRTLARLEQVFRNQVLPLLQEYFFDDWQRIQWVLNDHRKAEDFRFVRAVAADVADLFGVDVNVTRNAQTWSINELAFKQAQSYLGVIDHRDAQDEDA